MQPLPYMPITRLTAFSTTHNLSREPSHCFRQGVPCVAASFSRHAVHCVGTSACTTVSHLQRGTVHAVTMMRFPFLAVATARHKRVWPDRLSYSCQECKHLLHCSRGWIAHDRYTADQDTACIGSASAGLLNIRMPHKGIFCLSALPSARLPHSTRGRLFWIHGCLGCRPASGF